MRARLLTDEEIMNKQSKNEPCGVELESEIINIKTHGFLLYIQIEKYKSVCMRGLVCIRMSPSSVC